MKYTPAQEKAIYTRNGSVLVSAGAGSGKTSVLTERLMNYVREGNDIDRFVVITFTQAAASELRSRIMKNLNDKRQQALARNANIGTIHHFCAGIIRENLLSDFKIAGDERTQILKINALDRTMEEHYSNMDAYPGFEELVNTVGAGKNDAGLASVVMELHDKMQSQANPGRWAEERIAALESEIEDISRTEWGREIIGYCRCTTSYWVREFAKLDVVEKYAPGFAVTQNCLEELERRLEENDWDGARALGKIEFPRLPVCKEAPVWVKERRNKCKADMEKVVSKLYASTEVLKREMNATAPVMKALLELTLAFDREYAKSKEKKGILDYNDLEHKAAELLIDSDGHPTELARKISAGYVEIMVDEYQDVSPIQEKIFSAVSDNDRKLFMVGDKKQSIYRFRLADPGIFMEKYRRMEAIDLKKNYRSRREVIDCVNRVFSQIMTEQVGEVDYDEHEMLEYGADYEGEVPPPEILVSEDEPALIASKLRELHRDYSYNDMAILLRNANAVGPVLAKELSEYGIPVRSAPGGAFFETVEISSVVALLKAMDNPHMDIPLMTAMRSPMFNISEDELAGIRTCDIYGDFYSAVLKSDNPKCRAFVDMLGEFRKEAFRLPADKVIWMILDRTDIRAVCAALPDGEQKIMNLMQLIELAVSFEKDGYHGLHRFVMRLDTLKAKGVDVPVAGLNSEAVTIMSIHKSKGLEFPVVLLGDTSHRINFADEKKSVLIHPQMGLGPTYVDKSRMVQYPTLAKQAIALRMHRETLSEEMRLLYVAMTRAKERLVITAKKMPKEMSPDPEDMLGAMSLIDMLSAAGMEIKEVECASGSEQSGNAQPEEDRGLEDYVRECLSFEYPYKDAETIPSLVTASEAGSEENESVSLEPGIKKRKKMPDFSKNEKEAAGTELGTATHRALQYIDFSKDIGEEIARLLEGRFLSPRQADSVDKEAIARMLTSPTGQRIINADRVWREFKFSVLMPQSGEQVLLRGTVDCLIEENGELTVIDYKTDHTDRTEEYVPQMRAYKYAVERIFGMKVRETVLYYLSLGYEKSVEV